MRERLKDRKKEKLLANKELKRQCTLPNGTDVYICLADIAKFSVHVDAVVNPTNERFQFGRGASGSLSKAGGRKLMEKTKRHLTVHGEMGLADAVITEAGDLGCGFVIHVLSPHWDDYKSEGMCKKTLTRTFLDCFEKAQGQSEIYTIATPPVSSGEWFNVNIAGA